MKIKFLCLIIIQFLFFSCQEEVLEEMNFLNSSGKQVMDLLSTYENWEVDWDNMEKMGTPLPNEAVVRFIAPHNSYYIIPITNSKEITSIALFPLLIEGENRLVTSSPMIIDEKEAQDNILLQGLLKSSLFSSWKEKGYTTKFKENDRVFESCPSLSRHALLEGAHMFCIDFSVEFYYRDYEEYMECYYAIYAVASQYLYDMKRNGFVMGDNGLCQYMDASLMPFDEACFIFNMYYNDIEGRLWAIDQVTSVDITVLNMHDGTDFSGESQDNKKCSVCHKDPCECIRDILLTVKSTTIGENAVVKIGTGDMTQLYYVPLYNVVLEATDDSGNAIVENYVAIRFGVKYDENDVAVVKGLQDEMTYTISEFIPEYCAASPAGDAWRIFGGHLLHAGPKDPKMGCNMYGCIGICNGRIAELNEKLLLYSNAKTGQLLAQSGKFKIHVEAAAKPPLVRKD